MTPKEKAIELVNKYYQNYQDNDVYGDYTNGTKQCALIAVDEITKELVYHQKHPDIKDDMVKINIYQALLYWKAVKSEIEKL